MDIIRNEYIRGTTRGCGLATLRWFGHVQMRDSGYIGQMMLKMELPGGGKEEDHRESSWV